MLMSLYEKFGKKTPSNGEGEVKTKLGVFGMLG